MPAETGDFVLVEYSLRVKETGKLVDTTSEEEARKEGVYDPRDRYGPRLVIIGEGRLIEGLEESIKGMEEGEEKTVEIPPEKAFGKRDPGKVKVMPRSAFVKHGIRPEPGKIVEINGQLAVIRGVTGGRVVVDYNHPLAGRALEARIKLVKILRDPQEKLLHLLLRRLPPSITEGDVEVHYDPESKKAELIMNEKALGVSDLVSALRIVTLEAAKYMKDEVAEIDFVERARLATKTEQEEKGQEKKEEEASGELEASKES